MPASARVFAGASIPIERVGRLRLGQLERREAVELELAGVAVEVLGELGRREPQQRPRAALEQRPVQRADERHRQQRRADQHLLPRRDLEAPVAQQRRESVRVDHGASSSGKCSATCSRSVSRTNWRSSPEATR